MQELTGRVLGSECKRGHEKRDVIVHKKAMQEFTKGNAMVPIRAGCQALLAVFGGFVAQLLARNLRNC